MDMNGTQRIEAPREKVYAALNDVDVLKQSIPGCETIEKLSDTQMQATVTLKVGPVKASFKGLVTLSDLDPPNGYTITGEGSGGPAGFAKGGAKVTLEPDGNATILHYAVKADIGGKLAQLGGRLIDSTSKKLAGDFFEKFGAIAVAAPPPRQVEAPIQGTSREGWLSRIWATTGAFLQGWLGKLLGTAGALLLGVGVYSHACCFGGGDRGVDAIIHAPICTALGHAGAPRI